MKILVTGFEPFGGETINPASQVLQNLPQTLAGEEILTLQVPTVFHLSAQVLEEALHRYQPDALLCLGQAGGRRDLTLERVGINLDDASLADNQGQQPIDQPIRADGQPAYFSNLPIKRMVAAIREAGLPASVSNTAGTFVCNHLLYQGLYLADKKFPQLHVGFMHLPYLPEQVLAKPDLPAMSLPDISRGVIVALETLIEGFGKADAKVVGGATH